MRRTRAIAVAERVAKRHRLREGIGKGGCDTRAFRTGSVLGHWYGSGLNLIVCAEKGGAHRLSFDVSNGGFRLNAESKAIRDDLLHDLQSQFGVDAVIIAH